MKRLLFIEPSYITNSDNLKLLRVELSANYTKIDFGYQPTEEQKGVGNIKIPKETYISIVNEKKKFKLTSTENIAIEPKQLNFKTATDWLFFSIYFEPVPVKCCDLKLMEKKTNAETGFNFYSIELDKKKQFEIK